MALKVLFQLNFIDNILLFWNIKKSLLTVSEYLNRTEARLV